MSPASDPGVYALPLLECRAPRGTAGGEGSTTGRGAGAGARKPGADVSGAPPLPAESGRQVPGSQSEGPQRTTVREMSYYAIFQRKLPFSLSDTEVIFGTNQADVNTYHSGTP